MQFPGKILPAYYCGSAHKALNQRAGFVQVDMLRQEEEKEHPEESRKQSMEKSLRKSLHEFTLSCYRDNEVYNLT